MSTYSPEQIRAGGKVSDDELVLFLRYNVWVSGTMLGTEKKQCILSVNVHETVEGADSATIVIADPNFLFIEDNIFIEDNKIKIMLGWDTSTYRVTFNGYISAIDINFASDGVPVLTVTCMDNTHVMNREKKDATYTNCTNADVVKRLCSQYGFTCVVESDYNFAVQETITQSNQTDIEFITKLADDEVYPFTARLVGSTFYYVKMGKLETPKMTLTYRKYPHDIISFQPRINKETKKVEVSNSVLSTSSKSVATSTADTGTTSGGSANANPTAANNNNGGTGGSAGKTVTYNPVTRTWS